MDVRKSLRANLIQYPRICIEEIRQATRSLIHIACVRADIRSRASYSDKAKGSIPVRDIEPRSPGPVRQRPRLLRMGGKAK